MPGWSIVSVPGILGMVFITRIVIQTSSSDRAQPCHGPRSQPGRRAKLHRPQPHDYQSTDPLSLAFPAPFCLPLPIDPRST